LIFCNIYHNKAGIAGVLIVGDVPPFRLGNLCGLRYPLVQRQRRMARFTPVFIEKSDKIRETMYQRAGKIAGSPATLYLKSASFVLHFLAPPQNKNAPNPRR